MYLKTRLTSRQLMSFAVMCPEIRVFLAALSFPSDNAKAKRTSQIPKFLVAIYCLRQCDL